MYFWIILFLFTWIRQAVTIGCPPNWVSHDTKCYLFETEDVKVYQEADAACWSRGSRLVSIETQDEDKFISNWLMSNMWSRNTFLYTSGVFTPVSRSGIIWDDSAQRTGYGTYWLENRRRVTQDFSSTVYIIAYAYTGSIYEWTNVTSSYGCGYICEMERSNIDNFYILERDFEYGQSSHDKTEIKRGPQFILVSNDTVVFDGAPYAELECMASSNPLSTYTFYSGTDFSNKKKVVPSERYTLTSGKLTIQYPDENKDHNWYFCEAENEVGTVLSETINLVFGFLGDFPNNEIEPLMAKAFEGTKMECHQPRYSPMVTYWWFRNTINDMHITDGSENFFVSDSGTLYISEVQPTDANNKYYCVVSLTTPDGAVFADGNVPSRISLGQWLYLSPDSVTDNDYGPYLYTHVFPTNVLRGRNIRIECVAYGTPPLTYSWYREDGRPFVEGTRLSDHNRILRIVNAPLEADGRYVCVCSRNAGATAEKTVIINMDAEPYFPYPIKNMFADPGMTVVWYCKAVAKPSPVYSWYKDGELLQTVPGQYEIDQGVLTIHNVDKTQHEGMYQCAATNTYGTTFSTGQLKVLYFAPNFDRHPLPSQKQGALGGNVTIECHVEAAPTPEVRWLKNGGDMNLMRGDTGGRVGMDYNFNLVITDVQYGDGGLYTCHATNTIGEASNSTLLQIVDAIIITTPPVPTTVTVNRTAFMYCDAAYNPNIDIAYIWLFNGYPINTTLSPEFIQGNMRGRHGLQITPVSFKNAGTYECQLKSSVQTASRSAFLSVRGPPGALAGVHIDKTSVTIRSMRVFWTVTTGTTLGGTATHYDVEAETNYEPGVWFVVMRDIPEYNAVNVAVSMGLRTDQRAYNITDLIPNTHYKFRVRGINEYGRGAEASIPSESGKTPATRPVMAPRNVGGGGGNVGTLTITWTPLKKSEYCGPNLRYNVYWRDLKASRDWTKVNGTDTLAIRDGKSVITLGEDYYYLPYIVKVGAENDFGGGPNSSEVEIYSAEGIPQIVPVAKDIDTYNGTSVIVYWEPVPNTREAVRGRVKGYRVYYFENAHDQSPFTHGEPDPVINRIQFKDVYGQTDHCQLVGLTNNAEFFARVQVFNGAGFGVKGEWRRTETANDILKEYPLHVSVYPHDRHSILVRWRGVNGHPGEESVRGYIIRVWKVQEDVRNARDTEVEKVAEAIVRDLQINEVYVLRVLGWSNAGDGAQSELVHFVISGNTAFGVQIDPTTSEICFVDENSSTCTGNNVHVNIITVILNICLSVLFLHTFSFFRFSY